MSLQPFYVNWEPLFSYGSVAVGAVDEPRVYVATFFMRWAIVWIWPPPLHIEIGHVDNIGPGAGEQAAAKGRFPSIARREEWLRRTRL